MTKNCNIFPWNCHHREDKTQFVLGLRVIVSFANLMYFDLQRDRHPNRFPCCVVCICLSTDKTNTKWQIQKYLKWLKLKACFPRVNHIESNCCRSLYLSFCINWIQSYTPVRNIHSLPHFCSALIIHILVFSSKSKKTVVITII